jgi:hypothetical protein
MWVGFTLRFIKKDISIGSTGKPQHRIKTPKFKPGFSGQFVFGGRKEIRLLLRNSTDLKLQEIY